MIKAIVPIKKESERLHGKNFMEFCGQPLYRVVLDTLQNVSEIHDIIIDTDSDLIANDCSNRYSKSIIIERSQHLVGNDITMNAIIEYDLSVVPGEHFLQTHVTNPLITQKSIEKAINLYFNSLSDFDSLLSVECIKKRAYDFSGNPINHINHHLEQTQNLPPVHIENSNLFLFSRSSFISAQKSRVGLKPQLFTMSPLEGIDIDYKEDFLLAELVMKNKSIFNL